MKIVVCVKPVPEIRDAQGGEGWPVPKAGTDVSLNPFDEYAVETALRLKEANNGEPIVIALSVGAAPSREALKKAIAMGCDDAHWIQTEETGDSTTSAAILAKAIQALVPDCTLIFTGQYAIDGASAQTGPQLAEFLRQPDINFCKQATWEGDGLLLHRESGQGTEVHHMALPGLVAMMKCDYDPRTPSIKGVMRANRTEIPVHSLESLGLSSQTPRTQVIRSWRRPEKTGGTKVEATDPSQAVADLLTQLKAQKVLA